MAVRKDDVQVNLEINGNKAVSELDLLARKSDQLNTKLRELKKGTQEYADTAKELRKVNSEITLLRDKLGIAGMSMQQLKKYSSELSRELSKLTPGSAAFIEKSKQFREVGERLKQIKSEVAGIGDEMGKTAGGGGFFSKIGGLPGQFNNALNSLGPLGAMLATVFSVGLLIDFAKSVFAVTAEFQKYEAVLTNTLGSQRLARIAMEEIKNIAAATPFSVSELTDAYIKLANAGIKPAREQIIALGDLAASRGKSFDQLAEALMDATTGEFERMKEFGVKAKKVGDEVMMTFKGKTTAVKNTSEAIQDYIVGLGKLDGVMGGMAAQSQTLGGQLSNLGDEWDSLLATIGGSTGGIFSTAIGWVKDYIGWVKEALMTTEQIGEQKINSAVSRFATTFKESSEEMRKIMTENVVEDINLLKSQTDQMDKEYKGRQELIERYEGNSAAKAKLIYKQQELEKERENIKFRLEFKKGELEAIKGIYAEEIAAREKKESEAAQKEAEAKDKAAKEAAKEARRRAEEERKRLEAEARARAQAIYDAERAIEDLRVALIEDETMRKSQALILQTERQIEAVNKTLATEKQKAEQIILINQQMERELEQIQKDAQERREKQIADRIASEIDLINRVDVATADLKIIQAQKNDKALLEAMVEKLDVQKEIELQNAALTIEEKWLIEAQYEAEKDLLREEYASKELARQQAIKDAAVSLAQGGLQAISDFTAMSTDRDISQAERLKNSRIAKLDQELKSKKLNEAQYQNAKEAAENEANEKIKALRKKQAERDKAINIAQAIINTALAVTAAMAKPAIPPFPSAIAAGILGGVQVAKIAATPIPEFASGGLMKRVGRTIKKYALGGIPEGPSHAQGGISMIDSMSGKKVGEMEGGEPYMILSKNTLANNGEVISKLLDSSLYRNGAKIYENGGIAGGVPGDAASTAVAGNETNAAMIGLLQSIDNKVGQFPTLLKAYVVAQEINEMNELLDQIDSEANF